MLFPDFPSTSLTDSQFEPESDDAGIVNPVERDRHGDDNYSSAEDGSEIITVDSDNEEIVGNQLLGIFVRQVAALVTRFARNPSPKRKTKQLKQ